MDKVLPTVLILLVLAAVFTGLGLAWRARRRAQALIGTPETPPTDLGAVAYREDLLHAATTLAERPLERVTVAGLGFRAGTVVTVSALGVLLELAGADPVFVPRDAILGAGRGSWTIDKAVGADRLVVLTWRLGDTAVDTYLRSADPDALLAALPASRTPDTQRSDS